MPALALQLAQTEAVQNAVSQSSPLVQRCPERQRGQLPPQSTSLSLPFLMLSLQVAAGGGGGGGSGGGGGGGGDTAVDSVAPAAGRQLPLRQVPPFSQAVPSGWFALHLPCLRFLHGGQGLRFFLPSPFFLFAAACSS